jgi:hypothetical protein
VTGGPGQERALQPPTRVPPPVSVARGHEWSQHDRLPIALVTAAAALLWLAVAIVPATARGAGSSIPGHRFADLIMSGVLSSGTPTWLGAVWYATPFAGSILLASVGLPGRPGLALRSTAALIGSASSLGFSLAATKGHLVLFGIGAWCGVAAATCGALGIGWDLHTRLTRRGNHVL